IDVVEVVNAMGRRRTTGRERGPGHGRDHGRRRPQGPGGRPPPEGGQVRQPTPAEQGLEYRRRAAVEAEEEDPGRGCGHGRAASGLGPGPRGRGDGSLWGAAGTYPVDRDGSIPT